MSTEGFAESRAHKDLGFYFVDHPAALLSHWTAGKRQLLRAVGEGPVSTWDHLMLDFSAFTATRQEWGSARFDNLNLLLTAGALPGPDVSTLLGLGQSPFIQSSRLLRRSFAEFFRGRITDARKLAEQAVEVNPEDRDAQIVLPFMREQERSSTRERH